MLGKNLIREKKYGSIIFVLAIIFLVAGFIIIWVKSTTTIGKTKYEFDASKDNPYFSDSNYVYYQYGYLINAGGGVFPIFEISYIPLVKKVEGAEKNSFTVVEGTYIYRDNNNIYFKGKKVDNADAKSFVVLKVPQQTSSLAKDKNNVYHFNIIGMEIISGTDASTFEVLSGDFARDKQFVYEIRLDSHNLDVISGADPLTFKVLTGRYAKDKNNVYYAGMKITDANPNTIKMTNDGKLMDDKNIYDGVSCYNGVKDKCSIKINPSR